MPLHPRLLTMRDQRIREGFAPLYTLSVAEARAADLADIRAGAAEPEAVHEVTDREIPGEAGAVPMRVYRPSPEPGLPVLLYFFGGGWTLGSVDTSDGICRMLANGCGCVVVAVGYRLAPEARFPAAVRDCYAATAWVARHGAVLGADPGRIAVAGDSAGGNLAAAVTLLARDGGVAVAGQVLVYPNTDHQADTESMRAGTDEALFNRKSVAWYWNNYLSTSEDGASPLASPLRAESLAGLPPALVITAEYDPLRDEGEQYARRLAAAGVPVELTRYEGMVHGFFTMTGTVEAAATANQQVVRAVRAWFAQEPTVD